MFERNLQDLRQRFGLPMDVVCSHGDWMNRFLKMPNRVLTRDEALRARTGITSECYDDEAMKPSTARCLGPRSVVKWRRGSFSA